MSILKFKKFIASIFEAPIGEPKTDKEMDRLKSRQKQEKEAFKSKQASDTKRAREADFRAAESDKEKKQAEAESKRRATQSEDVELAFEALEDGTDELVKNRKDNVPGQ